MTLLAAFKTLLHRYTDREDIVVDSPIANRNRGETERLMGFFVNTLALRTDLSGNPSFRSLLRRVREVALGAYAHQDLPFEQLVEELQPQRDLSHTPLFQVMFVLQNAPMKLLELSGLTWSPLESESGTAKFDLTLYMAETAEGLVGTFEYNTDLFEADTIDRMAGHFQTLLAGILANPEQHLNELPLLTAAERQLLMEWNNAQTEYPQDRCLHELFEAQVERTPNAIAVVFEQQQLTYWELNAKANKIAHYLRKLGVDPEVLVGICVERSLDMVGGLLGILKAGGAYVPLDPAYPKERLAFMLSDAQVPVLLTQQKLVPELPENGAHVVCLDTDWERIQKESETNPVSGVGSENLAYVIYTSGSTGIPKGVAIEHRSTVALMSWAQGSFTSEQLSGVLASTSICFDVSVFELFVPLSWGGKVILAENALHLPRSSAAGEVTLINTVPSALMELLRVNIIPDGVRTVNLAGEPLPNLLVRQIYQQETIEQVFNLYGPSEDTTYSTFALCVPRQGPSKSPPIGRPVANTQVYILDRDLQPIPIGVPGELYVGGAGLARGYLNRPELTAERFIPNPFSSDRLYKTGDLARYLLDGNIEYLCRLDNQVKVRGFRIELGEIEAVLSQHPKVFQTVVSAREDHIGHQRLVAYIVPEPQQVPNAKDLRRFLKQKLPEYMVPSAFVMLEALPLTPNGKIDRRLLPELDITKPDLAAAFVASCTPEEKLLAKIWSELLGIEQVGIDDNFFELGGDSILVLQLIARANQAGLQLIPKHLFQYQTIAELAAVVGTNLGLEAEQAPVTGPLPLTPIQHWFFEENLSDPHHWNQSILLEIRQDLNPVKLEQALQQLLEHHDALRLRFERTESGWQQVNVSPDQVVPFTHIDLSALSDTEPRAAISAAAAKLQASLNLSLGPLVRVALFNLGTEQPSRLLLIIHHLAVDGVSWRILLSDLQTAYQQLERGEAIQLPPKTTSFQQWAERLREYAHSAALQQELEYWIAEPRLQIAPLPVDFPRGSNTMAQARTVSVALSVEETQALLQEVPAVYQTQINDVLLTALVKAFEHWTGQRSLLIELEGHGREEIFDDVNLSRTVGWFTTLFPVLLELGEASSPGEALKSIKEQLRSIPQRGIGYGLLRYISSKVAKSQLQALPPAKITFNYLGQSDQVFSQSSLFAPAQESSGPVRSPRGNRSSLIEINGIVAGGQLRLNWTYSKATHRQVTIESLAQSFMEALRELITHCLSPNAGGHTPSDFPQMQFSQQELDELLGEL